MQRGGSVPLHSIHIHPISNKLSRQSNILVTNGLDKP
jgi:hypothetical protein